MPWRAVNPACEDLARSIATAREDAPNTARPSFSALDDPQRDGSSGRRS
jgi:hypothetical protein